MKLQSFDISQQCGLYIEQGFELVLLILVT
jgi:hypothetical protein